MSSSSYIVKRGDNLSSIAQKHGIRSWQEIYSHPDNATFRSKRPNPNLIYPGDVVMIPKSAPPSPKPPAPRPPSPSLPPATPKPPATPTIPAVAITTVKFWLNAFIPRDIPGYTKPVPGGPFKGGTMIPGPPFHGDFLTDDRGFMSHIHAKSRMHSEFEVQFSSSGPKLLFEFHRCSETNELDSTTGAIKDTKTGNCSRMRFIMRAPRGSSINFVEVDMKCAASNPCVVPSPDIDYLGTITIDPSLRRIELDGLIDDFPAFEAYATINGGAGDLVFYRFPPPGFTVWDLLGDPKAPEKWRLEDLDGDGIFESR
jgi:hypothetical protein